MQAVVRGFLGLDLAGDEPQAHPRLPQGWTRIALHLQHRGTCYRLEATDGHTRIKRCEHQTVLSETGKNPDSSDAAATPNAPSQAGTPENA